VPTASLIDHADAPAPVDPTEHVDLLLRDLRASRSGLSTREAARRLEHVGLNVLLRGGGRLRVGNVPEGLLPVITLALGRERAEKRA